MADDKTPVWLIIGCSTGFGRELAKLVLARGWRAVVTARDKAKVADLAAGAEGRALSLSLDVTEPSQIKDVVAALKREFGRIDVLVNNAGYGYQASAEEGDDGEIRAMFDANVFGLFQMTQAVLPMMRQQRDGRILNITSVAGRIGFPSSGFYAASKHAVEGWADALGKEVGPLGIKVTNIEPGPFRTDWAGRSLKQTQTQIKDYEETVGARLKATSDISGTQKGDPVRAGKLMIELAEMDDPPRQIVLGAWGVEAVTADARARLAELEAWGSRGAATDFDAG